MSAAPVAPTFTTRSAAETCALGRALGALLQPGDFVGLVGPLGAGKTALARGIAEGAGVDAAEIASPTFAIVYPYAGRIPIYHADFYRLADARELHATGFGDLGADGATLVEWIDRIPEAAPADMLRVTLGDVGGETREVWVTALGPRSSALLQGWQGVRGAG